MSYIFPVFLLAISGYVLYSTITAKGKLFAVDNIKEELIPRFKKILRLLYGILGAILLIMSLMSFYQNIVYKEICYRFTDDFKTYYAESIDASGNIKGTSCKVDGVYSYTDMSNVFGTLPSPEVPEGVNPSYAAPAEDTDGSYLYVGAGESEPNQNETYVKLRKAFPYRASQIVTFVMMGLAIATVVAVFILTNKFTDKEKAAKARATQSGSAMPSSAFEFDDETESSSQKEE